MTPHRLTVPAALLGAALAGSLSFAQPASATVINEILASHTGTDDTEFVEFYGTPGASLSGLSFIVVEGDSFSPGSIDFQFDFGAGDQIGGNGFFLLGNPLGLGANYGVTPDRNIATNSFENSSFTAALVQTASIAGGSVTGGEVVLDAVALTDGDALDAFFFGAPVIGPDGAFFPAGARRVADGVDTDAAADWVISDFFLGAANTPTAGTALVAVPEPGALLLLGTGLLGAASFRRSRRPGRGGKG